MSPLASATGMMRMDATCADCDFVAIDVERGAHALEQGSSDGACAFSLWQVSEDDCEFVSADACERVRQSDSGPQTRCDLAQQEVAYAVSQGVVYQLEAIK